MVVGLVYWSLNNAILSTNRLYHTIGIGNII